MHSVRIRPDLLRGFLHAVFEACKVQADQAAIVADVLVHADLRGIYSHGSVRISEYVNRLQHLGWDPQAEFAVLSETPPVAVVDGNNGIGPVTAYQAMELAIAKAEESGIGWVSTRGGGHFGAAEYYSLMAAKRDMIGLAMTNASVGMAPWGGTQPMLGNNPWSVAVPSQGEPPQVVLDMANSVVARGKIRLAAQNEQAIPPTWALDAEGRPTTDPTGALKGTLAPIGEYKGYGITLIVDLLTGVLSGAAYGPRVGSPRDAGKKQDVGQSFMALRLDIFGAPEDYKQRVAEYVQELKSSPASPGKEILLPGERAHRAAQRQLREGITLSAKTISVLDSVAQELGVPLLEH